MRVVPSATLYRDNTFATFSVRQQLSDDTDDASRRVELCQRELRLFGARTDGRVLDLMCGVGNYVAAYAAEGRPWSSYLGIDVCPAAIDVARRRFGANGARFSCVDVTAATNNAPECDTVLLTYEAVNNLGLDDTRTVLRWAAGGLAADGRILVDACLRQANRSGREATLIADGQVAPVGEARGVAVQTTVLTSSADEDVIEHHVHWLGRHTCLYHVGYRMWQPSVLRIRSVFGEAGLSVLDARQVHHAAATEKASVRSSWQFVLGHLG